MRVLRACRLQEKQRTGEGTSHKTCNLQAARVYMALASKRYGTNVLALCRLLCCSPTGVHRLDRQCCDPIRIGSVKLPRSVRRLAKWKYTSK